MGKTRKSGKRNVNVPLGYFFERILAVPVSSVPGEKVFSKSWFIVRPHRAKYQIARVIGVCKVFHLQLTVVVIMGSVRG